jgi:hypothetical protein
MHNSFGSAQLELIIDEDYSHSADTLFEQRLQPLDASARLVR